MAAADAATAPNIGVADLAAASVAGTAAAAASSGAAPAGGVAVASDVGERAAAGATADATAGADDDSDSGIIREGLAEVLPNIRQQAPKQRAKGEKQQKADVFYNPAQVFNRDLSVVVLHAFAKLRAADVEERRKRREERAKETGKDNRPGPPPGLKILEALAATGIRSIRYVKELGEGAEGVRLIVANDLDATATAHIRRNLAHNEIPEGRIAVVNEDANAHMYMRRARGVGGCGDEAYDVIDLDPYGTCSLFLDAAVQSVADGGLLCITSTDMPVLGGNSPETCFTRYGGSALKASYVHEMSLRLVLHAVASAAAKYGREAVPLISCSIDFYVRLFVRIFDSPARAKRHCCKTGVVFQCVQCESFVVQPFGEASEASESPNAMEKFKPARVVVPGSKCPECGGRVKVGGPFHLAPMYDASFVKACLESCEEENRDRLPGVTSWRKILGMLTAISEEHADLPLFYRLPQLCKSLKLPPVPLRQFRSTLISLGFRVSHFHREPEAIKTDAPPEVVYDLMRLWAEEHPPKNEQIPDILKKPFTLKRPIEWTNNEDTHKSKVPKFLPNPEPNWGPKARARGGAGEADTAMAQGGVAAELPAGDGPKARARGGAGEADAATAQGGAATEPPAGGGS